jgi:pseudomonalisin
MGQSAYLSEKALKLFFLLGANMMKWKTQSRHATRLLKLSISFALMSGICLPSFAATTAGSGAQNRVLTRNHAVDATSANFEGYAAAQEPISVTVALKVQNKGTLDSFTSELFRPSSLTYHQWMTRDEAVANFSPTQSQAQAVATYLTQNGFTNVHISSNRLLVTADGTVGTVRQAFQTQIGHFRHNGKDAIANVDNVSVPASLGATVDRVLGLQTLATAHTFSRQQVVPYYTIVNTGANASAHAYFPEEFATVYDAGSTPTASNTTVALIGWGSMSNAVSDLGQYESSVGMTAVPTSVVSTSTQSSDDDSGQGEWALDAQAMVGIAGSVQNLIFYTDGGTYSSSSGSSGATDSGLLQVINEAVSANVAKVVNISWGLAECNGTDATGFADSVFEVGVAQGQTFVAASGDNGSYPCDVNGTSPENGSYSTSTQLSVNYPASSPYVVSVGGTTLNTTANDSYISESAWPYSGGGVSAYENTPNWQEGYGAAYRQVPDLAFDADWNNSPIAYYLTASSSSGVGTTGWYLNGGTSLASPLFVGAWARLESASSDGLGFAAPSIYAYSASVPFHDVTSGSNGYYNAVPGYDNATGWGSFDIAAFNSFIQNTPGFGAALDAPSVAISSNGEAYVFWKGADNNLWQALGSASGPLSVQFLGMGPLGSAPSAVVNSAGATYIYFEANDHLLNEAWWNGSQWMGPIMRLSAFPMNSPPSAVLNKNGEVFAFFKGPDNNLWEAQGGAGEEMVGAEFSNVSDLGMGPLGSNPSAGIDGNGATYVYWEGTDRNLWEAYWNGSAWVGPISRGMGPMNSAPSVAMTSDGTAYVFWRGTDNGLWEAQGNAKGPLGNLSDHGMGPLGSGPTAGVDGNGYTYVYWRGTDKNIWEGYWNGHAWVGPYSRGGDN